MRVGYDMENIAVGAKVELYKQGDQLEKIGDNVNDIDSDLNVSHKTMDEIKKRRRINKLILYGIIALIALSTLLIIYFKVIAWSIIKFKF